MSTSFPVVQLDSTVFPSEEKTISVEADPVYGGAHHYHAQNCLGFNDGKTDYQQHPSENTPDDSYQTIQFVQKADDGTITPGLQSEQLVLILLDRHEKLNARFPSPQNEEMIAGLKAFLNACEQRVKDRMERGVMGNLAK